MYMTQNMFTIMVKEDINNILAQWNPVEVPAFIAQVEYESYVNMILEHSESIESISRSIYEILNVYMGIDPSDIDETEIQMLSKEIYETICADCS